MSFHVPWVPGGITPLEGARLPVARKDKELDNLFVVRLP
jgi:hypothetical protein